MAISAAGSHLDYASISVNGECRLAHDKEVDPGLIPCALPRASKDQMNEWGLPIEVPMCNAGKQCFYHHRGWTTESSKAAYAAIEEEPSILA